jgi:DNA-binding transcriptional ArsR family regulator
MKKLHKLTTLAQVRAISAPLRQRILEKLIEQTMTAKQVAVALGENPTKLYHHVQVLEALGLIELVRTEQKRGTTEKYYHAIAESYTIDEQLMAGMAQSTEGLDTFDSAIKGIFAVTQDEIRASLAAKLFDPNDKLTSGRIIRSFFRASPKQIAALNKKLSAWVEACEAADDKDGELAYSFMVAFYPIKDPNKTKPKKKGASK